MPAKDSKTPWRMATILLGSMMTIMAGAAIAPGLPGMARHFSGIPHVETLVKSVLTTHALFIIVFGPFAGWLLDRWGRKPVLIGAMVLYGLAGSSGFAVDSIPALFVGRAFLGMAVAAMTSGFVTLIGDYFEDHRRERFMGIQAGFMGLGGMVFIFAGGMLADAGWRYPFLVYLYAFLVLPMAVGFLYEPERVRRLMRGEPSGRTGIPYGRVALIYAVTFLGMDLYYMVPVHAPFLLRSMTGVSNTQVGLALSLSLLPSIAAAFMYRRFKERFSHPALIALFFLIMGSGYASLSFSSSYATALLSLAMATAGMGFFMPTVNVWLVGLVETQVRGRVMGGMTTCVYLGQFLCPILTQPLVGWAGLTGAFRIVAYGLAALALAFAVIAKGRQPEQ